MSDVHSPRYFRVNGPLPNIDAWYSAFDVQAGRQDVHRAGGSRQHLVGGFSGSSRRRSREAVIAMSSSDQRFSARGRR